MRCFILLICLTLFLANECQGKPFFFHHFACNIICPDPFTAKGCVFCRHTGTGNVASANAFGSSSDPKSKISAASNVNINNAGGESTTAAAGGETTASEGGESSTTASTTASTSAEESTTASTTASTTESTTASTPKA